MERIPHPADIAICNWLHRSPIHTIQEDILTVAGTFMNAIAAGKMWLTKGTKTQQAIIAIQHWYIEGEWSEGNAPTSEEDEMQPSSTHWARIHPWLY